jgi:hypothetical protein
MRTIDASFICDGLWVGSAPPTGHTLASTGFSVLALCAEEHQPPHEAFPGMYVVRVPLIDDGSPLTHAQIARSIAASEALTTALRRHKGVLVTCMQGRNRSGFVAALTFARMTGCDGRTATRVVQQRRRSPFGPALTNREYNKALALIGPARERGAITAQAAHAAGV